VEGTTNFPPHVKGGVTQKLDKKRKKKQKTIGLPELSKWRGTIRTVAHQGVGKGVARIHPVACLSPWQAPQKFT